MEKVSISNLLIESKFNLKSKQLDLFLIMVNKAMNSHESNNEYNQTFELNKAELINKLGLDSKNFYRQMKEASSELIKSRIDLKGNDGEFVQTSFLSEAIYIKKGNYIYFTFAPMLLQYLANLHQQGNYTTFNLLNFLRLRSKYAKRIYLIVNRMQKIKDYTVNLDELKYSFALNGKYDNFSDFERHVLRPAIEQIFPTMPITYRKIKKGKKVIALKFQLLQAKDLVNPDELPDEKKNLANHLQVKYKLAPYLSFEIVDKLEPTEIAKKLSEIREKQPYNVGAYAATAFRNYLQEQENKAA